MPGTKVDFGWTSDDAEPSHGYIVPHLLPLLARTDGAILDLGSGNGALTSRLAEQTGRDIVGIDADVAGIRIAQSSFPRLDFRVVDFMEPLPNDLRDRFATAISIEVVEHLLLPGRLFDRAREAGANTFLLSTPYHGYLKNLLIAVAGKSDVHWHPDRDFGHIKFFSPQTLDMIAKRAGWVRVSLKRVGRVPPLAKSMIVAYQRDG